MRPARIDSGNSRALSVIAIVRYDGRDDMSFSCFIVCLV